jgi:hypothetical protein
MFKAMLKNNDPTVLSPYFFNVFAHSQHTTFADKFSQHFLEVILNDDRTGALFSAEADHIKSIFLQCTNEIIFRECVLIVNTVLERIPFANSLIIAESLFDSIASVVQNWRVLPQYLGSIISFCKSNLQIAIERQWISQFVNFIQTALSTKSSIFIQNIDLSTVFDFLNDHIELTTSDEQNLLLKLGHIIIQGQAHINSYLELIRHSNHINISDFINEVLANIKDCSTSFISLFFVQIATTEEIALKFLNAPRVSKEALVLSFTNEHHSDIVSEEFRQRLLECPTLLFRLITWDVPKVIYRVEHVMVLLFRPVTSLIGYRRAESPLLHSNFSKSIDPAWKDSKTITLPVGKLLEQMIRFELVFLDGFKEICDNPKRFLSGPIANRRLTHFLRVCIWILIRTQLSIPEQQMIYVLDLLETIRQVNLQNDANIIELVRFTGRAVSHDLLATHFNSIVDIIFTRQSNEYPVLRSWLFSVFFDSFTPLFESRPELFENLVHSQTFQTVFLSLITDYAGRPFEPFAKIVAATHLDVSELLLNSFDDLITNHTSSTIQLLSASPHISLNDTQYTSIIESVLKWAARESGGLPKTQLLRFSLEYAEDLTLKHTLLSTDSITGYIFDIMGIIPSHFSIVWGREAISLFTALAKRSLPIKQSITQNVKVVLSDPESFSWLLVILQLAVLDNVEERRNAISSAVDEFLNGKQTVIDPNALLIFGDVIIADGIQSHSQWAIPLFVRICKMSELGLENGRLLTIIAKSCTPEEIFMGLGGAIEVFTLANGNVVQLLEKLKLMITVRPELKQKMIAMANLDQRNDELRSIYGGDFPEVFE